MSGTPDGASTHAADPLPPTNLRVRMRVLLALALPAVGALVADPLMGLVDTAVVGRIGAAELGGLGLAVAVLSTVSWVFNFLVYGTTSSVAKAIGAGERELVHRRIQVSVRVALLVGVVAGSVMFFGARPILAGLGAVEELLDPGATYLRIRALGVPLILLVFVGHGAFRGMSDTRTPLLIAVGANVLNVVLTLSLVGPFGIAGVAVATVIAELAAVAAFVILLPRLSVPRAGLLAVGRSGAEPITSGEVRALLVVGRDLFLRTGGLVLGMLAMSAAAARMGAATAAAHQVLRQMMLLASFALDGLAVAGQTTVGTALGRRDRDEALAYGRATALLGFGAGLAMMVLLLALGSLLPRVLTDDALVLATIASAWWLLATTHVTSGTVFALDGVMMGAEDYRFLRNSTALAALLAGGIAQVLASQGGTIVGIWWCVHLMMAIRAGALVWRLSGRHWVDAAL